MITINSKVWKNKYMSIKIKTDIETIETGIIQYRDLKNLVFEMLNEKGYNVPKYSFKYNNEFHETIVYVMNKKVDNKKDLKF